MEEDWSIGENQTQEGTSKFIVLDSQEQVDEPQQDWPALQPPMAGSSEANNNQQPNKSRGLSLIGDLSEDERKLENAEVLVLDSEIEGTNFLHKQSLSNKGYRLPSDADEVISESEDQVNETVLERPPKGDGKSMSEDDENQTEASGSKTIHSSTGSGSSFHSNSRQGLGSYQHAEMSHTGLQGHRFRMFQETLSQDIFQEDQEDNRESSTPSEFIGSLQLSNQPMLVPETVDEEENAIPPSPTAYGNVPMIIPSSPTAGKSTDIDDLDEHEFNPAAESTFADNPSTRHSQSSEESGLYHDSSSGKSEEPDVTVKKVSPRSLPSDEGNKDVQPEKISTLITDDVETCGESLHLRYSATESHSNQQREESVEVVEVEEKNEDSVIIISFDEGTDQGDVTQKSLEEEGSEGIQSQDLVLHLTPSQYSKSQASQRGSNSSQKQNLTHSPALDPLSQGNADIGGNPEKDKSNTSNSDSAGFHLSLPKDGTLLHPVELSPGQNQPSSQTSLGQNQPPSQMLSPHYPTPPPGPSHQGPHQDTACETRPVPAPSLTIDMIDTQTSMSEPGFTLHRPEMREIPSEQTEDSRFEVFRQKKGTGKLTRSPSKRQIINDGSDDECTPVGSGNKRTREETLSPRAESQQLPRLKKTRTLSSEATSTGYQASMEGMDTASPTEHMEVQEDVEDIMMQETESYDVGQTVQAMDVGGGQALQVMDVADTSEQHHTQIKTCGVDAVGKDRQPFQIVTGNTHRQTMEDSGVTSPKPPNVDMSIASEDLSHLERVKETIKHGHRRGKSKGKKSILKKRTEHDKEMTGISDRQKETGLQDPYIFHGSQSQMTSPTKSDTVPLVHEADVGQDQTETSEQQPVPGSSKMETTPTTTRKKWNRAVHKKSGVKKAGPSQHVSFHNSVKNKSTPPRTETPKRTPKPRNRTSDSGPVDREVTRTAVAGQLAVRSPSVNPSTTVVTPITEQTTSIVQPTVSQSVTMAPPPAVTPVRTTPICQDLVVGPLSMTTSDSTIPPLPQETVVTKTVYRMWLLECKEITQTFRSPDGRVTRQTTKKEEDPPKLLKEVTTETTELLSVSDLSPSPSRSTSTMTSGDLADVSSSMSRSSSGSNRGSRQNLASLEGMGISQVTTEKSATDMDTYFTPPEPVSAPVRRTSALEKPTQTKPNETTRRSSTQPSDFEISPHVGELSTINKTGSDVMETSHLTEEKRHSESLFTSSTEDCEKLAEEKEKTDESEKTPGQVKDLGDISESSEGIPCGQTTVSIAVSSDGVEHEAKSDVREPATSDTTSNDPHSSKRRKRSETSGSRSSEISPQISYQDPTLVRPDPALLCTPPTKGSAIKSETVIGARVLARWKDGFYYPGTISHILKSKYQVRFDDGDVRFVKVNDLLLIERLPIGQSVFVQDEGGYFEPGIITDHKSPMDAGQLYHYVVEQDNGTTAQFRCSQVILSDDQAQCLVIDLGSNVQKSPHGPPPTTPKTADISLDNLVDSKRRMSSRYEQQDLPNQKTRPKPTMDAPTTSTSHSSSSVKRKRGGTVTANPVATSTPTPAKTASSRLRTAVVGLDASPVGAAVSSPVTPRRSPRKARIGLFHGDRDARPRRKTTLFRGIVFLLTHVDKTKEQKEEDKKILEDSSLDVSTDESSSNVADEPTIPFDKNQLKVWIEDGGGIMLEKYNEDEVSSARQCILLSDTYQRTVKYFQCLAAGLLCLSHVWVYDCYSEDQLLDHKAYILPSGISLEKRRLMEWKPTSNLLVNMKVMVESDSDRFKEEWTAIIRIAGGEAETKIQTRNQRVNVILSDKTCPNSVVRRAKQLNIPVVSTEWMIQCLINSRLMAYDGHPKYRYDYNQS